MSPIGRSVVIAETLITRWRSVRTICEGALVETTEAT